jgi:hypothetical protein
VSNNLLVLPAVVNPHLSKALFCVDWNDPTRAKKHVQFGTNVSIVGVEEAEELAGLSVAQTIVDPAVVHQQVELLDSAVVGSGRCRASVLLCVD